MKDKRIQFRRVRGHIVPIKIAEGAGIAGAGLGVAAAAGHVAARLTQSAARAENEARKGVKAARKAKAVAEASGPLFAVGANKKYLGAGREALRTMVVSRQKLNAAINIRNAGHAVAGTMIAGGVHRALSGTKLDKKPKTKAAIATGSGVAATFALKSSYLKKISTPKMVDAATKAAKEIILKKFGGK
jgi:hypothetical protein